MDLPNQHPRLMKRPFSVAELLADGIVHSIVLVAGILSFAVLLAKVAMIGDYTRLASLIIYAIGFFFTFGFSLAYNMAPISPVKWVLRRFDHASIYIMIAGTYTAMLANGAAGEWSGSLLAFVWIGAIGGTLLKILFPGRWDRLSIVFFLILGFSGLIALGPLSQKLPMHSLYLLIAGGLTYATGIIFYLWKSLKFQNVIWHGFVGTAASLHFAAVALSL